MKEACAINKSLSCLGEVFLAIGEARDPRYHPIGHCHHMHVHIMVIQAKPNDVTMPLIEHRGPYPSDAVTSTSRTATASSRTCWRGPIHHHHCSFGDCDHTMSHFMVTPTKRWPGIIHHVSHLVIFTICMYHFTVTHTKRRPRMMMIYRGGTPYPFTHTNWPLTDG